VVAEELAAWLESPAARQAGRVAEPATKAAPSLLARLPRGGLWLVGGIAGIVLLFLLAAIVSRGVWGGGESAPSGPSDAAAIDGASGSDAGASTDLAADGDGFQPHPALETRSERPRLKLVEGTLRGHQARVTAVRFFSGGELIASGSVQEPRSPADTLIVWDAKSGGDVASWNAGLVSALDVSPDGRHIVTGTNFPQRNLLLWERASGRLLGKLEGHAAIVLHVAFSPDGKRLVSTSHDGRVICWDPIARRVLSSYDAFAGKTWTTAAAWHPTRDEVLLAISDGELVRWNPTTGDELMRKRAHIGYVACAAVSRDGARYATGGADRTARIWSWADDRLLHELRGHSDRVTEIRFLPDGRHVLSAGRDGTLRLWDADNGEELLAFDAGAPVVTHFDLSPDGKTLVAGGGAEDDTKPARGDADFDLRLLELTLPPRQ
jgi:WD40 repeat protein